MRHFYFAGNETSVLWSDNLGQQGAAAQLRWGLVLLTKVRKNMKALPLTLIDRLLLNARNMAETIIGHIKAFARSISLNTAPCSMLSSISWPP